MTYFARVCLEGLRFNPLRSLFTGLGVLVGVTSVVLIVTLSGSFFSSLSTGAADRFTVGLVSSAESNVDVVAALQEPELASRVAAINQRTDIAEVIPQADARSLSVTLPTGRQLADLRVEFSEDVAVVEGTGFTGQVGNVAILYRNPEFDDGVQVGSAITIDGAAFTVVGLTSSLGESGSARLQLPARLEGTLPTQEQPSAASFVVAVVDADDLERVRGEVLADLNDGIDRSLKFVDFTADEGAALREVFQSMSLLLGLIASISLAVAALNIVNVMYISTLERADEVAIYRSLGMTKRGIQGLFLLESTVIVSVFALLGCVVGNVLGAAILVVLKVPVTFSWGTIAILMLVTLLVGVGGGLYPASRAARIDPVRLLR